MTATASVMKPPSAITCQNCCNKSGRMKIEYSATDNTQSVGVAITARTQGSPYDVGRPQSSALCSHRRSAALVLWVSAEDFAGPRREKYWPVVAVTSGEPAR